MALWQIDSATSQSQPEIMCNLYRLNRTGAEVAGIFGTTAATGGNVGAEVYPGYPGWVIAGDQLRTMTWGFPLTMKGKQGQPLKPKPVNNARTDKLESGFWRPSFQARRCLIPVEAFAEAEGPKGAMCRTWLLLPDQPVFLCAGIWRESVEWGAVYSMVMTDPCETTACVHDRMPVILRPEAREQWLEGSPEEALALCRPYEGAIIIERTTDRWVKRADPTTKALPLV